MWYRLKDLREKGIIISISLLLLFIIMPVRMIQPTGTFNPIVLSSLLGFVLYYISTFILCKRYQLTIKPIIILCLMILGLSILQLPIRIINFRDTFVTFPDFIISLLGIFLGYISFVRLKLKWHLFFTGILLCMFMWFWGYNWFLHWLSFDSINGKIEITLPENIYVKNSQGDKRMITPDKGEILVLDCWYDGCGACFVQFPKFQELSHEFKSFDYIHFYALGVMFNDSTNLFDLLEKRNIHLPMLSIEKEGANEMGITAYPTVIIITGDSKIIFKGTLEMARPFLKKLTRSKRLY